ncbi:MAG: DUF4252 domain-containing protein [Bacteroidota bacterium]
MNLRFWAICALIATPFLLQAQSPAVNNFFERYNGVDAYTSINLGGGLLALIDDNNSDSDTKIKRLKVLSAPYNEGPIDQRTIDRFIDRLESSRFEEMDVENEGTGTIQFFMDEEEGIISELVMVLQGDSGYTVMSLTGSIPLDELDELDAEVDVDGLDRLNGPY